MKKGFSLSITLFVSIILLSISFYFLYINKKELYFASKLEDKLQAYVNAKSFSEKLKFYIATGKPNNYYIQNKLFNLPSNIRVDNYKYNIKNIYFSIQDCNGLFSTLNINSNILARLTNDFTIANDSLLDWLDKDNLTRPNGAEKLYYLAHNLNYFPRNKNFLGFSEELSNIRGYKNFNNFKNFLTFTPNNLYNYLTMPYKLLNIKYGISFNNYKKLQELKTSFNNKKVQNFAYSLIKNKFNFNVDLPFMSDYFIVVIKSTYKDTAYNLSYVYDKKKNRVLFVLK